MAMSGPYQRQMVRGINHRMTLLPIHGVGSLVRGPLAAVWGEVETATNSMRRYTDEQARADYGDTKW